MLFFFIITIYFKSPSISTFNNPLFLVASTPSLKVIHATIIIDALPICLLVVIFIMPLESLITHPHALLFSSFESLKFNLKFSLIGGIQ